MRRPASLPLDFGEVPTAGHRARHRGTALATAGIRRLLRFIDTQLGISFVPVKATLWLIALAVPAAVILDRIGATGQTNRHLSGGIEMTTSHITIKCPECGHEFDISDVLYDQVEHDLKKQYEARLKEAQDKFRKDSEQLEQQKAELDKAREAQQATIDRTIRERLRQERQALSEKLTAEIREEESARLKDLQKELQKKTGQVKEFHKAQAEIERLKRAMDEAQSKAEADAERRLNELLAAEREKIRKSEEDKLSLKIRDKDHVIQQLSEQLKDMQRKAEQGSMQVQGEVQELAIEEWLAATYPLDSIEEIKKGARGGDCIQTINTRSATNCGRIYYESKRTKAFQPRWVEKFKRDVLEKGANIGVLVTESMPADMPQMGQRDGIWVCTFADLASLSQVLRDSLITIHRVLAGQENRGDKMSMVYDFVTSNEFRLQVEAIVEGFTQMQSDLEKEKRAMARIWKQREKQIEKVLLNTSNMYGSIRGIAGSAIPAVRHLELPGAEEEDEFHDERPEDLDESS
jgi:hypothetical protein